MQTEKEYYTPKDIAQILHTTETTVRYSILQGFWQIPYFMCGNRMRIFKEPFNEWLKTGKAER